MSDPTERLARRLAFMLPRPDDVTESDHVEHLVETARRLFDLAADRPRREDGALEGLTILGQCMEQLMAAGEDPRLVRRFSDALALLSWTHVDLPRMVLVERETHAAPSHAFTAFLREDLYMVEVRLHPLASHTGADVHLRRDTVVVVCAPEAAALFERLLDECHARRAPVCSTCGCTEDRPCVEGDRPCAWATPRRDTCTACAGGGG